jgi:hypothetical protein
MEIKVDEWEKMGGEGGRKGRSPVRQALCKQGTWSSRHVVNFEHRDIEVSGPTTYDLYWDRAQQRPNLMLGFLSFNSVKLAITLRLQVLIRNK